MDKLRLEIDIPETVYAKLESFIMQTVDRAFTEKAKAISKERVKLTRIEAAKRLKISLPTLDKHIESGTIKGQRVGRRVLIPEAELESFLNRGRG